MPEILSRFLSFEKMLTGTVVKFLYYIALIAIILGGLYVGFNMMRYAFLQGVLYIVVGIPLAIIYARIVVEFIMVIFRISDNLAALRKMKEDEASIKDTFS